MDDSDFYRKLTPLRQFEDFAAAGNYQELPPDWVVFVTDIENSTSAIEEGLYKEVNLVGAASITLTMQVLGSQDMPFVFGGDGATICVQQGQSDLVAAELARLVNLARTNFGLELRVACIPVSRITNSGRKVLVSKLEITPGKCIALFHGGGLALADRIAKDEYEQFGIAPSSESVASLQGLSCRWSPMPSKKGVVISLLVRARHDNDMSVYSELLQRIRDILDGDIASANPVYLDPANYKSFSQALREESAYHHRRFSYGFVKRIVDVALSVLIFRFGVNPIAPFFNGKRYKSTIAEHSDYRKFDDVLRLIMDCSEQQCHALQECLQAAYEKGEVYYGLHASGAALMTCFVENTNPGGHLHFIDGGDGGLAMASRQLKAQMAESRA